MNRNSHWRCSIKISVLEKFTILTGKHLCWCLFFKCVPVFKNTYFEKYLRTLVSGPSTRLEKWSWQIFSDVGGPTMVGSNVRWEILKKWSPRLAKLAFPRTLNWTSLNDNSVIFNLIRHEQKYLQGKKFLVQNSMLQKIVLNKSPKLVKPFIIFWHKFIPYF